jgi:hypothetical protein
MAIPKPDRRVTNCGGIVNSPYHCFHGKLKGFFLWETLIGVVCCNCGYFKPREEDMHGPYAP